MFGNLQNFKVAKFNLNLVLQEDIQLPIYKGSLFRGAFGYGLKKVSCVAKNKDSCEDCLLKTKCVYSYIFETPIPENAKVMKKYPFAPHPFIIEPPLDAKTNYKKDEELIFNLILIGKAIEYLPYFIYTFVELGKSGIARERKKFLLKEVFTKNSGDNFKEKNIIYTSEKSTLTTNFKTLNYAYFIEKTKELNTDNLTLNFLTPTRLKYNEKLVDTPEFHIIIRNLLRRASLLNYFHCDSEIINDNNSNVSLRGDPTSLCARVAEAIPRKKEKVANYYKETIASAEKIILQKNKTKWYDWERYSTRKKTKIKMGGFLGNATYTNNWQTFAEILLLGEYLHIGKGCSFGLGKYKISNN